MNVSFLLAILLTGFPLVSSSFYEYESPPSLLGAVALSGDMAYFLDMLADGANPADYDNEAIRLASRKGHADIVQHLLTLDVVNPTARNNEAIRSAIAGGHLNVIKVLLDDPRVNSADVFKFAVENPSAPFHDQVLQILYESPRTDITRILQIITSHKLGLDLLETFLKHDQADLKKVIPVAYSKGHFDHLKIFLSHPRAGKMINFMDADDSCQILLPNPMINPNGAFRAAVDSEDEKLLEFILSHANVSPAVIQEQFTFAAENEKLDAMRILLSSPHVNPSANNNEVLRTVIRQGSLRALGMLLRHQKVDPGANNNEIFQLAVCARVYASGDPRNNHVLVALLGSERINPNDRDGVLLPLLLDRPGKTVASKLMAHPLCDPKVNNNFALRVAIRRKDMSALQHILPCAVRPGQVDPNIPIYAASTPLMEAVRSGEEEIVRKLTRHSKFRPKQADLDRAMAHAREMKYDGIMAMLEAFPAGRVRPGPEGPWSFSVDPAKILVWLKDYIRIKHTEYGTKSAAVMVQDILAGKPSSEYYKGQADCHGYEPLKLAYEDFMQSRPEMSEADRKDLFVRIMTTDFVPEFLGYGQPANCPSGGSSSRPLLPPSSASTRFGGLGQSVMVQQIGRFQFMHSVGSALAGNASLQAREAVLASGSSLPLATPHPFWVPGGAVQRTTNESPYPRRPVLLASPQSELPVLPTLSSLLAEDGQRASRPEAGLVSATIASLPPRRPSPPVNPRSLLRGPASTMNAAWRATKKPVSTIHVSQSPEAPKGPVSSTAPSPSPMPAAIVSPSPRGPMPRSSASRPVGLSSLMPAVDWPPRAPLPTVFGAVPPRGPAPATLPSLQPVGAVPALPSGEPPATMAIPSFQPGEPAPIPSLQSVGPVPAPDAVSTQQGLAPRKRGRAQPPSSSSSSSSGEAQQPVSLTIPPAGKRRRTARQPENEKGEENAVNGVEPADRPSLDPEAPELSFLSDHSRIFELASLASEEFGMQAATAKGDATK